MIKTKDNTPYLSEQIITYLGNKRSMLNEISLIIDEIALKENKDKFVTLDLFSGSGIVARLLKQYSSTVIANDLEHYSSLINECYLSNKSEFNSKIFNTYKLQIEEAYRNNRINGIISQNYAPKDENNITCEDRVFYTKNNAERIDSYRYYIDQLVPENYKKYFLAVLLSEASIHVNTSGVFKGFYKDKNTKVGKFGGTAENALLRIKGSIELYEPVLSDFETEYKVYQSNANDLVRILDGIDIAYLDPPYNQHPYGSNYFMLNTILDNTISDDISKVSGIPKDWNHSDFNVKTKALSSFEDIIRNIKSKYVIISYNNEGFITFDEMVNMLSKYGTVNTKAIEYNTFRGSRNLRNRDIHTNEYLFVLEKGI